MVTKEDTGLIAEVQAANEKVIAARLDNFVALAQAKIDAHYQRMGYDVTLGTPQVAVENGRTHWKLTKYDVHGPRHPLAGQRSGGASVYCFVRKADGAIRKGTWKAPIAAAKVRGYITWPDDKINEVITDHGVVYLR